MEEKLIAAIIPLSLQDRDAVLIAKKNLLSLMSKEISFSDEILKLIYSVVVAYFKQTSTFLDTDMFKDILTDNGVEPELLAKATIKFDILIKEVIPEDQFAFYLQRVSVFKEKRHFQDTLVEALDILGGADSLEENQTSLDKAKELIVPVVFESSMLKEDVPHGDIMDEADDAWTEYQAAKKAQQEGTVEQGIKTGLKKIDEAIDFMYNGDLVVLAGASGEGKSFMAANIAHYVTTVLGKNVLIVTAETKREQYRRRINCCHSNNVKFGSPVEMEKVKKGLLSEEEEEIWKMVLDDMAEGKKRGIYGRCEISQIATGTTLSDIYNYAERLSLSMNIDLILLDYLTLFKPTQHRSSQREEAVELFKECKQMAIGFNKGRGVPIICLHQISTQSREKVKWAKGKCYTLGSLADSSEAGKSADICFALLRTEDMEEEHELGVQILKTRDSFSDDKMFKLYEAYQFGYLGDLEE